MRFFLQNLIQATVPSNVPLINPASAKAVIDTAGLSLVRGGKQLARDLASAPRIPEMVDGSGFVLGDNIAATAGGVVFRNEVLELIQYAPQTDEVYEVPALVVPPTINTYYALDLAPGRSLWSSACGRAGRCSSSPGVTRTRGTPPGPGHLRPGRAGCPRRG